MKTKSLITLLIFLVIFAVVSVSQIATAATTIPSSLGGPKSDRAVPFDPDFPIGLNFYPKIYYSTYGYPTGIIDVTEWNYEIKFGKNMLSNKDNYVTFRNGVEIYMFYMENVYPNNKMKYLDSNMKWIDASDNISAKPFVTTGGDFDMSSLAGQSLSGTLSNLLADINLTKTYYTDGSYYNYHTLSLCMEPIDNTHGITADNRLTPEIQGLGYTPVDTLWGQVFGDPYSYKTTASTETTEEIACCTKIEITIPSSRHNYSCKEWYVSTTAETTSTATTTPFCRKIVKNYYTDYIDDMGGHWYNGAWLDTNNPTETSTSNNLTHSNTTINSNNDWTPTTVNEGTEEAILVTGSTVLNSCTVSKVNSGECAIAGTLKNTTTTTTTTLDYSKVGDNRYYAICKTYHFAAVNNSAYKNEFWTLVLNHASINNNKLRYYGKGNVFPASDYFTLVDGTESGGNDLIFTSYATDNSIYDMPSDRNAATYTPSFEQTVINVFEDYCTIKYNVYGHSYKKGSHGNRDEINKNITDSICGIYNDYSYAINNTANKDFGLQPQIFSYSVPRLLYYGLFKEEGGHCDSSYFNDWLNGDGGINFSYCNADMDYISTRVFDDTDTKTDVPLENITAPLEPGYMRLYGKFNRWQNIE